MGKSPGERLFALNKLNRLKERPMRCQNMIELQLPGKIVFGEGSFDRFAGDAATGSFSRLFVLCAPEMEGKVKQDLGKKLKGAAVQAEVCTDVAGEPTIDDFERVLKKARAFRADAVAGIGGGSVMDTSKLVAAMVRSRQETADVLKDTGRLRREVCLVCLPTTSGTGSEVSPNVLLYDAAAGQKVAVIHPCLVPDAAYADPSLTLGLPPALTASTGMDALTHCIEAYTNVNAHTVTDIYALSGIRLIGRSLARAVEEGSDPEARARVALGSLYGGMCLGPVNTAAVHALAYPLGNQFRVAHGVSNAVLLPHVMEFNSGQATKRYAAVAAALGVKPNLKDENTALKGIQMIRDMIARFGLPSRLSALGIPESSIGELAVAALKVQRLLRNNIREVTLNDAITIYRNAL